MKFEPRRSAGEDERARLPLTSLIDVIFLLLIYFLFVSSMAPVESQLPSGLGRERGSGSRAADLQPQVVSVELRQGRAVFRIGERVVSDRASLAAILGQLPKQGGVFVRVADAVAVESAAAALQAARDAGFTRVSYVPSR